jgi:hypothetical protein
MPHKQTEDQAARSFSHGSSGSTADLAVEGVPKTEDRHIDVPHARAADPLTEGEKHDHLADKNAQAKSHAESHQEALLDEALEETFPSSDPISPKHIT